MPEKRKPTAEELWQRLVDETGDALIEEAASISVEQAEKDLAAAGFDVGEVYARADAFLADLGAGPAPSSPGVKKKPQ